MKVEKMSSDSDAKMVIPFTLENSVRQMGQRKVTGGIVGGGEPALVSGDCSLSHAGMIARIQGIKLC